MTTLIINFFQDSAIYALIISVLVLLGSNLIPTLYKLPIQLICIGLIVLSTFLTGAKEERKTWELKVSKFQSEISELKAERTKITSKVNTEIARSRELIKENSRLRNAKNYITPEENSACVIPDSFIKLHNDAVDNSKGSNNAP